MSQEPATIAAITDKGMDAQFALGAAMAPHQPIPHRRQFRLEVVSVGQGGLKDATLEGDVRPRQPFLGAVWVMDVHHVVCAAQQAAALTCRRIHIGVVPCPTLAIDLDPLNIFGVPVSGVTALPCVFFEAVTAP